MTKSIHIDVDYEVYSNRSSPLSFETIEVDEEKKMMRSIN